MTVQERFAQDYGMPAVAVRELVRLAKRAGRANERHWNGDPHPLHPHETDKAALSMAWGNTVDGITSRIRDLVQPFGFTDVVYTGLGPTLKRGELYVEIPY